MADHLQEHPWQAETTVSFSFRRKYIALLGTSKYIALAWTNSPFGPHDHHGS
jgi:hypothetical protein